MQLSQEVDRLNHVLDRQIKDNNALNQRLTESQQARARLTQEIEENRRRLRDIKDLEMKISEYENKIAILTQQIERLNMNLKKKLGDADDSQKKYRNIYQDYENAKRRIVELESTISEIRIKISTYQQKITVITQENEDIKRNYEYKGGAQNQ